MKALSKAEKLLQKTESEQYIMEKDLVSVIVPTYRRDSALLRALESAAGQTYEALEIILVDDNADAIWNSKVESIVDQFRRHYENIPLIYIQNPENLGSAETRNAGIHASNGSYICFLDDDDLYLPNRISSQLTAMERIGADFSITDLKLYNEHEKLVDVRKRDYIADESQLMKYHMMYHITGTDTMMFRREYLLQIGCFDPINVGDEFYLMAKAIQHGGKFLYVPGCEVKAYVHTGDGGLSSGQGKIEGENQLFVFKQMYFEYLDKPTVRYINMRHHAVLAYAYFRNGSYGRFLLEGLRSVAWEPMSAVRLLTGRV